MATLVHQLEVAAELFKADKIEEALEAYTAAVRLANLTGGPEPDRTGAADAAAIFVNIGVANERLGRSGAALAAYSSAVAWHPASVQALHNRGVVLHSQGKLDEALESFSGAVSADPSFVPSHRGKTLVLTALERFDDVLAAVDATPTPHDAATLADKGFALLKTARFQDALDAFQQVMSTSEEAATDDLLQLVAVAASQRASELEAAGDKEAALVLYAKAADTVPTPGRRFNHALCLMRLERLDDALAVFTAVLELESDHVQANIAAGTINLQQGNAAAALPFLTAANAREPSADLTCNIGFALVELGKKDEAKASFEAALALEPDNERAQAGLKVVAPPPPPAPPVAAKPPPPPAPVKPPPPKAKPAAARAPTPKPAPAPAPAAAPAAAGAGSGGSSAGAAAESGPVYPLSELQAPGPYPDGINVSHRERYLSAADFMAQFKMDKDAFAKLPTWKRNNLKKAAKLF